MVLIPILIWSKQMPKFEVVKNLPEESVKLPLRSTEHSAGYDFHALQDVEIPSCWYYAFRMLLGKPVMPTVVYTGVKAKMATNEVLLLFNRSSNPKRGLIMANGVGVVDSDYYGNKSNDGNIAFMFYNVMPWKIKIHKGDRIGQGIFSTFKKVSNDETTTKRTGGIGSTGS